MSETLANDKNNSGISLDSTDEPDDSSVLTITSGSLEKLIEEELNSLSLIDCVLPSSEEHLSPSIQQKSCETKKALCTTTDQLPNCETIDCTPSVPFGQCDEFEGMIGLLADSDDWLGAGSPCDDESCAMVAEETWPKSFAEYPEVEYSQPLKTPQAESTTYYNGPSASELLVSVVQSYRDALNDQKTVLARQTDALNRLAAAIESQTKMIDMLHKSHHYPV